MSKHYENFPVASLLLPRRLRRPVGDLYAFARTADDIADEGDAAPPERLRGLAALANGLRQIEAGQTPATPMLRRLAETVRRHQLPLAPFHELLSAFRQDVRQHHYDNFDDLLAYCQRSANPVGQLMLRLFAAHTPDNLLLSNAICTSLQLINFLQDVAIDKARGRVYLPVDELQAFGIRPQQFDQGDCGGRWAEFMRFQTARTRRLMCSGAPLTDRLPGRIGLELRLVVLGGLAILDRIDAVGGDVFHHRPALRRRDWLPLLGHALLRRLPDADGPGPLLTGHTPLARDEENL